MVVDSENGHVSMFGAGELATAAVCFCCKAYSSLFFFFAIDELPGGPKQGLLGLGLWHPELFISPPKVINKEWNYKERRQNRGHAGEQDKEG